MKKRFIFLCVVLFFYFNFGNIAQAIIEYPIIGAVNENIGLLKGYGHGSMTLYKNHLTVVFSKDSGVGDGGFAFVDIRNPNNPKLVHQEYESTSGFFSQLTGMQKIREAHGWGFCRNENGFEFVVLQTTTGIQLWDWNDLQHPKMLADMILPGVKASDYSYGAWWTFCQAPYVYVGGSGNGLFIVDIRDVSRPVLAKLENNSNPIPVNSLGGFRVGPVFAIGNLLVATSMDQPGFMTLDISNPLRPTVLAAENRGLPPVYSTMVNGNKIYSAGNDGYFHIHDISNPRIFKFLGKAPIEDKGGYLQIQDNFAHVGASDRYRKIDIRNPQSPVVVGETLKSAYNSRTDWDFANVIGNLVMVADDHGYGTAIVQHDPNPDKLGPIVTMALPQSGANNIAPTSAVGITLSDQILVESVNAKTFLVRPKGGAPLRGSYSIQTGIINFVPSKPFASDQVYEIILPVGGIKDLSGNGLRQEYRSEFSTPINPNAPLQCEILGNGSSQANAMASWNFSGGASGSVQASWDFGDGNAPTNFSNSTSISHAYTQAGHYPLKLTLRRGAQSVSCAKTHTVYNPLDNSYKQVSSTVVYHPQTQKIYTANVDSNTISIVDIQSLTKVKEIAVATKPQTISMAPNGEIWVVSEELPMLTIIDSIRMQVSGQLALPRGSKPYGIVFHPTSNIAYVSLSSRAQLAKINYKNRAIVGWIDVVPSPRNLAIQENRLFVARFLSSDSYGEIAEIDTALDQVVRTIPIVKDLGPDREDRGRGLPNYLLGMEFSPDGKSLWYTAKKDNMDRGKARDGLPLTFENSVRTIVGAIDLTTSKENISSRIDFNDRALSSAIAFSTLGDYIVVTTEGTNTVEIYDAYSRTLLASLENIGFAPNGIIHVDMGVKNYLVAHNFLSRSISVFDVTGIFQSTSNTYKLLKNIPTVAKELLPAQVLLGKQIFYNARDRRMSRDAYISCAVCHLDGGHDGRTWDFTDRGEGLRNTTTLLGRAGMKHGPVHWSGNFDEIQDFEQDIRNAFLGTGFMKDSDFNSGTRNQSLGAPKAGLSPELDAMAAYVASLDKVGASPYRSANGAFTTEALRGKQIFEAAKCMNCHSGNNYTDSALNLFHNVGTLGSLSGQRLGGPLLGIDTPTLKGLWGSSPYLHDGSATSIIEVLLRAKSSGMHGELQSASEQDLQALEQFLLQVED